MTSERPVPVGDYEILQDFDCPSASVRVLRLKGAMEAIHDHVHRRSMQIYVGVGGRARVRIDGQEVLVEPYQAVAVWPGSAHGAVPVGGEAILVNISIPPLGADDQRPV